MANTFELIQAYTATGSETSFTFNSIPATFTDLVLKTSTRKTASGLSILVMTLNSASGTQRYIQGVGSGTPTSATNASVWGGINIGSDYTANTFSSNDMYIPNYLSSNAKSMSLDMVSENNATTSYANLVSSISTTTSAITTIKLEVDSGTFVANSTAYLYGVKNA
jgi:hypothetical protein